MKLDNLQVLRGISALLVCCFHFRERLNYNDFKWGDFLFSKGSIGVPIFFVISGFIMVFTTSKLKFEEPIGKTIKDFLLKRIIRIVPLYYLLTFGWIFLGGGIAAYLQGENLSRFWHSLLFLPQKDQFPVLYLGWSLNVEMYFYLLFALSFLFRKYRYHFIISFLIFSVIIGQILTFSLPYLSMMTDFINIYFVVGMILGLSINYIKWPKKIVIPFISLSIFSFILFLLPLYEQWTNSIILLIISSLVLSFLQMDISLNLKPWKLAILIGDASFSLYLVHSFIEIIFRRFSIDGYFNMLLFLIMIMVSIGCSYLFYKWVEIRVTSLLKRKLL